MWFVNRSGSHVDIRNESSDEIIAIVGVDSDPRIMKRVADATIMAQAPQMLDALIDVQNLIKREFIDMDHPLAELVTNKIDTIIKKCFSQQRERYVPRENRNFRRETYGRDNQQSPAEAGMLSITESEVQEPELFREPIPFNRNA